MANQKPLVTALMLANGRPDMCRRAVKAFQHQTYENRKLLIYDTGQDRCWGHKDSSYFDFRIHIRRQVPRPGTTIGELRNEALNLPSGGCDIVVHWDSDDWSHPKRIEDQVALLEAGKALECVGYRDMVFWMEQQEEAYVYANGQRSYCLGTSMCYWFNSWTRHKFDALPKGPQGMGEDFKWMQEIESFGATSFVQFAPATLHRSDDPDGIRIANVPCEPRMIASIHGSNSTTIAKLATHCNDPMMRRAPIWDKYCRERMAL